MLVRIPENLIFFCQKFAEKDIYFHLGKKPSKKWRSSKANQAYLPGKTNSVMNVLSRREAIKKAAIVAGGMLAIPDILKAWSSPVIENTSFRFLPAEGDLIADIAETIIPRTSTPGAKDAGVPAFIQKVVADCYDNKERTDFMAGVQAVDDYSKANMMGKGFSALTPEQRITVLKVFEKEHHNDKKAKPWWGTMKGLVVTGFFTSEIGCTQILRYEHVPGKYDGAYPYKKGDKTWAT